MKAPSTPISNSTLNMITPVVNQIRPKHDKVLKVATKSFDEQLEKLNKKYSEDYNVIYRYSPDKKLSEAQKKNVQKRYEETKKVIEEVKSQRSAVEARFRMKTEWQMLYMLETINEEFTKGHY